MSSKESRKRVRITKTFVESLSLKPGFYVDEKVPSFRLKVTPAGKKIYLVYGKPKGYSNAITYTIGHHGQPAVFTDHNGKPRPDGNWTAEKAEKEAQWIYGLMRVGTNPNQERKNQATADQAERAKEETLRKFKTLTLKMVFNDYIKDKSETKTIKESTAYVYQCDINKCLADWLDKPLMGISEEDIEDRHKHISRTHPGQANHVMRILRAVFYYAIDKYKTADRQPIITNNPVRQFSKQKRWNRLAPRNNIIKDHQLKAFFEACRLLEHPTASDYLPFLLLTGLRAEEAASLPWSQVDLKRKLIHVTDTKNGKDHRLPLTDYLYALLKSRWQSRKSAYVFSMTPDSYASDYRYQVERVVERIKEFLTSSDDEEVQIEADSFDFMPHDLRRTFGTTASRLLPDYIVKRLLNHISSSDVTQTHYIHADIEKLREPMQAVSNHILNCAGVTQYGAPAVPPVSKVVRFQKKRKKAQ